MPVEFRYIKGITGRGEVSRLMLQAGAPAGDYKIADFGDFSFKTETLLGKVPFAVIDGQKLPQSAAIDRAIARKYGFFGSSENDVRLIDAAYEQVNDVNDALSGNYPFAIDAKKILSTSVPALLEGLVTLYAQGAGGPFLLAKVSLADFATFQAINRITDYAVAAKVPNPVDKFPRLQEVAMAVSDIPALAAYLNSPDRPKIHAINAPGQKLSDIVAVLPASKPMITGLRVTNAISAVVGGPCRATLQGFAVGVATAFVGLVMWGTYLHKQDVRRIIMSNA